MMNSDGSVRDDIEGLIYQTIALIDLQSDEDVPGVTEGVLKTGIFGHIIQTPFLKTLYVTMAKPCAQEYIKMQKVRK
jgi:hypothetical protein